MRSLLIALALLFVAAPALADDAALNALVADYTSYAMGQDPITAGRAGDKKALAKMPDVSPGADVLRKSFLEEFKERLAAKKGPKPGAMAAIPGPDPELINDLVTYGSYHFERGLTAQAEWNAKMVEDIGDAVKPYLRGAFATIGVTS